MLSPNTILKGLTNIGPTIAARLEAVGVRTVGDLRRIGPARVFQRVKANNPGKSISVCYYLYSLQGALEGKHWDDLTERTKHTLLQKAGEDQAGRTRRTPANESAAVHDS